MGNVTWFFSNDIITLKEEFLNDFKPTNPFNKELIVVPNINLKKYLQLELARKNSISANLNILYLESGLFFLLKEVYSIEDKYIFLNETDNIVELQLMIITVLKEKFDEFKIIKNYLKDKNNYKLLWQLSKNIAFYFREYQYQIQELVDKWENNENYFDNNEIEKEFRLIYREIFCEKDSYIKKFSDDNVKYTTLPILVKMLKDNKKNENKKDVYLFGFSQISKFHYDLITKLSFCYNFKIFQLNYQGIDYNFEFKNNNEFIKKYSIAIEKNIEIMPKNLKQNILKIKDKDFLANSLLNCFKKSLLKNINSRIKQDTSIQIIGCPSIKREVETVYNSIIFNMLNDENLKLTDIAILVTDIDRYRYEIKNVFDYYNIIKYNLNDFSIDIESNFLKAILKFLELIGSNYRKDKIVDLITNPLVMKKFNFDNQDIEEILNTIEQLNIYFSYDTNSKERYSHFKTPYFTWEYGLQRTRVGYLVSETDFYEKIPCYSNSYLKDVKNIEDFNNFFEILFYKLNINTTMSGKEWKEKLIDFINTFIEIEEENHIEENVKNSFLQLLDSLERFDNILKENIDIEYIKRYIEENIEKIEFRKGSFLSDGVTISKMLPMKPIPFKIIYIMGLNEDVFPSYQSGTSIDLRQKFKTYITKTEVDNYLFLETILSAQNKLYLTYVSKNLEKDATLYPSSCIKDLISYMNKNILIENFKTFEATINLEDEENFINSGNEFTDIYDCCINEKIRLRNSLIKKSNTLKISFQTEKKEEVRVNLWDLKEYIFNPKKILLKNKLRVDLTKFEKLRSSYIEPFYEEKYEINNLRKEIFLNLFDNKDVKEDLFKKIDFDIKIGEKPEDFYSDFIKSKITEEIQMIKNHKEKIRELLAGSKCYKEIVFDFLDSNYDDIFEPYYKDNFCVTGKIEKVFKKNDNNLYFFDFYETNVITVKEKKINNKNLIKNIFRTVLEFGLFSKKKEDLVYNYLIFQNNKVYLLTYKDDFGFFDKILDDYIKDINSDSIYDIDFDIISTKFLIPKKEFKIDDYKKLIEYQFDDGNANRDYKIEDKDILLKGINIGLTEDIFNRRYNIIKEINIIEINEV